MLLTRLFLVRSQNHRLNLGRMFPGYYAPRIPHLAEARRSGLTPSLPTDKVRIGEPPSPSLLTWRPKAILFKLIFGLVWSIMACRACSLFCFGSWPCAFMAAS